MIELAQNQVWESVKEAIQDYGCEKNMCVKSLFFYIALCLVLVGVNDYKNRDGYVQRLILSHLKYLKVHY